MLDPQIDGRLQVTAAASLLEHSQLLKWCVGSSEFIPVSRYAFEESWRNIDIVFGRLICWINFSAGAEFLIKGVCLLNGIEIRRRQDVPDYPHTELDGWIAQFRKEANPQTIETTRYGVLGNFTGGKGKPRDGTYLGKLCGVKNASQKEEDLLFAAYSLLGKTIRNRDAHAYVPNVRESHFDLVSRLFVGCFNLLVSWLPGGPEVFSMWRQEAQQFLDTL